VAQPTSWERWPATSFAEVHQLTVLEGIDDRAFDVQRDIVGQPVPRDLNDNFMPSSMDRSDPIGLRAQ